MSDCDGLFQEIVRLQKAVGTGDVYARVTDLAHRLNIPAPRVEACLADFASQGRISLWARHDETLVPFAEWLDPHEVFNCTRNGGTVTMKVLEEMPRASRIGF